MPGNPTGPLCFVLMPFGQKPDAAGNLINFDAVYKELIAPAVTEAGMTVIRADEEQAGGIIHKAMFERLVLCRFSVADLTTANANVYYELGVRHAARPRTTLTIMAEGSRLPFDLNLLRTIPYPLAADGTPDRLTETVPMIAKRLATLEMEVDTLPDAPADSPVFTLLDGMVEQQIVRENSDVFRQQVQDAQAWKEKLEIARRKGVEEVRSIETALGPLEDVEAGLVVNLFVSYRAVEAWSDMIRLVVQEMPAPLASTVLVQEQYALALNRAGEGEEAEAVLLRLLDSRGASSETYGILGRVYKDRWEAASRDPAREFEASGLLEKAIDAYVKGFEADFRDAFPGINAVTLMSLQAEPDPRLSGLVPVVTYAVERRIARGKSDYWDHATRLELAVIAGDEKKARSALASALAAVHEIWQPKTTARNLDLIREVRQRRGEDVAWLEILVKALRQKSQPASRPAPGT